jgi:hypothetical protein
MASASWKKAVVKRSLKALAGCCASRAGAGRPAVLLFGCHLASITSAADDDEVKRLADRVLLVAEGLFLKPPDQLESQQRLTLLAAREDLCGCLKSLDLVD